MYLLLALGCLIALAAGIYFYRYLHRIYQFWFHKEMKLLVKVLFAGCAVCLAIGCLNPFGKPALVLYHILGISIALDLINGIVVLMRKKKHREYNNWKKIYRSGMVPLLLTLIILSYGYYRMLDVKEKTYEVITEKHFQHQKEYKAVFISDLHFGNTMNEKKLQDYCDEITARYPDFVILGGDIVDERSSRAEMEQAFRCLGDIRSRYGIFYVYGNHDSASYSFSSEFTVEDLNRNLEKNKIHILSDKVCDINDDIILAGRDNKGYGAGFTRMDTVDLLQGQDLNRFILLVDHQPVDIKRNASAGVDLQLSGHTHGGQIWPVGLISDLLGFGEKNYGEEQFGTYKIIVSSGMAGWGYPIRTGHDSEYLMVTIRSKN